MDKIQGGSTRMKPGAYLLDPELLTEVAEGAMADVQELHPRFDPVLTPVVFKLLVSAGYETWWTGCLQWQLKIVGISPLPSRAGKAEKNTMARSIYAAISELTL